ncbi:MAG: glycosyltransferase family 39 protein [Bacteroidota bacterium]
MQDSVRSPKPLTQWILIGLFLVASYFLLFLHLDQQPLKNYDESFFALRAYRLAHYGEYLYNYKQFPDGPSGTNLKTPFFSMIQAASFKVFGYNELALRLPVAITVLLLLLWMIRFGKKEFGSLPFGLLSAAVLLTSWGFIHVHVSRTGDHDAPLAAFTLMALMYLYKFFEWGDGRHLLVFTVFMVMASLTKGVAGLFVAPGMVVYALLRKKFVSCLKDKRVWLALGSFLFCVVGYYLYREIDHPGFLRNLWLGELGGHFLKTRDGHKWPFFWFLSRMVSLKYTYWMVFLPIGLTMAFHPRFREYRHFTQLLLCAWLSIFLVISNSETKLEWYDASLYPIMAFMVGIGLTALYEGGQNWQKASGRIWPWVFGSFFVLAFFFAPYRAVLNKTYQPKDNDYPGEYYGYLIKQAERLFPEEKKYTIVFDGYSFHCLFYQLVYNQQKGFQLSRKRKHEDVVPGELIMSCQGGGTAYLRKNFETENLTGIKGCVLMRIGKRKEE